MARKMIKSVQDLTALMLDEFIADGLIKQTREGRKHYLHDVEVITPQAVLPSELQNMLMAEVQDALDNLERENRNTTNIPNNRPDSFNSLGSKNKALLVVFIAFITLNIMKHKEEIEEL